MVSVAHEDHTVSAERGFGPDVTAFSEQDLIDRWNLSEQDGVAMIVRVDTSWFSAVRWAALINQELDGSEAAVWDENSPDSPYITSLSNRRQGRDRVLELTDGEPVLTVSSYDLADAIEYRWGDIDYLARGKIEALAEHFGSIEAIEEATKEEIEEVPYIGVDIAQRLHDRLEEERADRDAR